jgi:hypothetical protein
MLCSGWGTKAARYRHPALCLWGPIANMKYGNDAAPLSHQLRVNQAVLEYLKLLHQHWTRNTDIFGDPENVAIARLVVIGWMESSKQGVRRH